jgi:hypothetical protein
LGIVPADVVFEFLSSLLVFVVFHEKCVHGSRVAAGESMDVEYS